MQHLGIKSKVNIFSDGQETVEFFERILNSLEYNKRTADTLNASDTAIQPVSLVVLDINMPMLNGYQV